MNLEGTFKKIKRWFKQKTNTIGQAWEYGEQLAENDNDE